SAGRPCSGLSAAKPSLNGAQADTEPMGCARSIAPFAAYRSGDDLIDGLVERAVEADLERRSRALCGLRGARPGRRLYREGQIVDPDSFATVKQAKLLDDITKLADVAGPIIGLQCTCGRTREPRGLDAVLRRDLRGELADERCNVSAPLS